MRIFIYVWYVLICTIVMIVDPLLKKALGPYFTLLNWSGRLGGLFHFWFCLLQQHLNKAIDPQILRPVSSDPSGQWNEKTADSSYNNRYIDTSNRIIENLVKAIYSNIMQHIHRCIQQKRSKRWKNSATEPRKLNQYFWPQVKATKGAAPAAVESFHSSLPTVASSRKIADWERDSKSSWMFMGYEK